jgi:hypothetical protein
MQDPEPSIRRRKDGSIDTTFYVARGRIARAEQALRLLGGASEPRASSVSPRLSVVRTVAAVTAGAARRSAPTPA